MLFCQVGGTSHYAFCVDPWRQFLLWQSQQFAPGCPEVSWFAASACSKFSWDYFFKAKDVLLLMVSGPIWRTGALALRPGGPSFAIACKIHGLPSISGLKRSMNCFCSIVRWSSKFSFYTFLHQPVAKLLAFMCKGCNFFSFSLISSFQGCM